jgi:DNA-binding transcriptional LysR family regulator
MDNHMSKTPSLDDLARFRKVVDKGSFAAAARDLGIPKSTLSKAIARLEQDLGVRLLERTTRNMRPTETGRIVAEHGKTMVDAFDAAQRAASDSDGPSGRIRVGCPPGLLDDLLDDVIADFLTDFPKVRIELVAMAGPLDLVRDDVDITIRARSQVEAGASHVVRRLGVSRGILVAAPSLAGTSQLRTPRDLQTIPTLCLPGDNRVWELFDRDGAAYTIGVSPRLVTSDIATLRHAAIRGLGVALLPEHACMPDIVGGELMRVLPDISTVEGTIYAVFSRDTARALALRAFIDHLASAFAIAPFRR